MSRRFCTCGRMERSSRFRIVVAVSLAALLAGFPAAAEAETDTIRQEGVTIRLVALEPDGDGLLRAALSIELEPGWKTYWIAPGPVGLAPQLDFSASSDVAGVDVAYPVPLRFSEGEAQSVGYAEPTALSLRTKTTGPSPVLRLRGLLGICREICVPVQVALAASTSRSLSDRALVARAEAAAPAESGPLQAKRTRWNADRSALLIEVEGVAGASAPDAFVAAGDGWSFGAPMPAPTALAGMGSVLTVPVLTRPPGSAEIATVDVLLTQGEIAQLSRAVQITPR